MRWKRHKCNQLSLGQNQQIEQRNEYLDRSENDCVAAARSDNFQIKTKGANKQHIIELFKKYAYFIKVTQLQ